MSFTHAEAASAGTPPRLPRPPSDLPTARPLYNHDAPQSQHSTYTRSFDESSDSDSDGCEAGGDGIGKERGGKNYLAEHRDIRKIPREEQRVPTGHGNPIPVSSSLYGDVGSTSRANSNVRDFDEFSPLLMPLSSSSSPSPPLSHHSVTSSLRVYRRRWYVLALYSALAFAQGALGGVWAVVARSVEATFGWTDEDISLMQTWIYLSYLAAMFPFAWLMETKGLRPATILTAAFMVVGTILRCISTTLPYVTRLAHAGHILVGLSGPVAFTAGPMISARWFPPHQRGTATAVATVAGFAGGAGCFLFGPLMVDAPIPSPLFPPGTPSNFTNIDDMKREIILCRYIECGVCALLLALVLGYFPSNPPSAPSLTAAMGKLEFISGLRELFKRENANFWLICLPYCTSVSIYGVWSGLFGVNLKNTVSASDVGWLGFSAVSAGCIAAIIFGRISDLFVGHMKAFLLILNVGCVLSTFWFILITQSIVSFSRVELYAACILQGLCNNGAIPLFYELAIENTYPITEVCISTVMTVVYNILPLLFLLIFLIPNVGTHWMNWCMYGAVVVCFPILLAVKEKYKRSMVDRGEAPAPPSLQASYDASYRPLPDATSIQA